MRKIMMISSLCLCFSCASNQYIIDPKSSTNPENYYADKMECESIAKQEGYLENMGMSALIKGTITAIGAGAMTYFGIGSGANLDLGTSVALGAGAGAVGGLGLGAYDTYSDRKDIIRKCMEGRGYNILK
jgi:hypothetical protein|tara:strand:- start:1286 stop:1675 length:390 start_codon:yes stop_codon:yes gene_type:complete